MSIERDIEELHKLHGLNPTEKLIVDVKGTPFIKAAGIVKIAHAKGIGSLVIETQHQDWSKHIFVVKATYTLKDGMVFEDFGSASPASCKLKTGGDVMIMVAATRAKVRAMRTAHGISLTAVEEMAFEPSSTSSGSDQQKNCLKDPRQLYYDINNKKDQKGPLLGARDTRPNEPIPMKHALEKSSTPSMLDLPAGAHPSPEWKKSSAHFRASIKELNTAHVKIGCKKLYKVDSSKELTSSQLRRIAGEFSNPPTEKDIEFSKHWETQITSYPKTEEMQSTALDTAKTMWQFVLVCQLFEV